MPGRPQLSVRQPQRPRPWLARYVDVMRWRWLAAANGSSAHGVQGSRPLSWQLLSLINRALRHRARSRSCFVDILNQSPVMLTPPVK